MNMEIDEKNGIADLPGQGNMFEQPSDVVKTKEEGDDIFPDEKEKSEIEKELADDTPGVEPRQDAKPSTETGLAPSGNDLPAWMQDSKFMQEYKESSGQEINVNPEDLETPRLKVIQNTSRENYGVAPGNIVDTGTCKSYGTSVEVIPLIMYKSRVLFNDDGSARCLSADTEKSTFGEFTDKACKDCEFSKWKASREHPDCCLTYNYGLVPLQDLKSGTISPGILSLMKSGVTTAKQINSQLFNLSQHGRPIFARTIRLKTKEKTFSKGKAFVIEASVGRYLTDEEAKKLIKVAIDAKKLRDTSPAPRTQEEDDLPF